METPNKDQSRSRFRSLRRALPEDERQAQVDAASTHLLPWLRSHAPRRSVAWVMPYGAEPPTGRLMESLHEEGYRILVPVCEPERRLRWTAWYPGVAMGRCAVAPIDEPVGERFGTEVMEGVDVVLVPAQAVDSGGGRLGQGGGYYDRFIASLDALGRRPVLLAMVYAHELVPAGTFPVDGLDRPVDGVLTERGFTWFSGRVGA